MYPPAFAVELDASIRAPYCNSLRVLDLISHLSESTPQVSIAFVSGSSLVNFDFALSPGKGSNVLGITVPRIASSLTKPVNACGSGGSFMSRM